MPRIISILFEDKIEESYIAIELDGIEPEVLFMKGPAFVKQMGPFPVPYAEATFKKWNYCMVENPPEVDIKKVQSIADAMTHIVKKSDTTARYCSE